MNKKQPFIFFITMAFLSSHTLSPMGDVDTKFNKLVSNEAAFNLALSPRYFPTLYNHLQGYFEHVSKNMTEQQEKELKAQLVSFAESTVPVCSDDALTKAAEFLTAKKQSTNPIEQNVYLPLTFDQYIFRLYHNRPLVCYQDQDDTLLMGKQQTDLKAYPKHALIGTSQEEHPFVLEDLISYPEREISELFGISSPTFFINNGDRDNKGNYSDQDNYEKKGIFVGLVGPRYENPCEMACKTLIDEKGKQEGDIKIIANNLKTKNAPLLIGKYFRPSLHTERMKKSIEPFLIDIANAEKNTYVHVVNLGGGWWSLFKESFDENDEEIKASFRAYKELLETHKFPHIDTIDFSWFTNNNAQHAEKLFEKINDNKLTIDNNPHITIKFSLRNTADKLTGKDAGKRLVAMYAWDSASGPGNEFLLKALSGSGDPAAACCSLIFALQHTRINGENIFNNIVKRVAQFIAKHPQYADLMNASHNTNYANLQAPASPTTIQENQPSELTETWYQKMQNLSLQTKISIGAAAALVGGLCYYYWYTRNQ